MDITCNVVSMLPVKFDQVTKVEEHKEFMEAGMARHRHVCYYVMNNGCIKEQNAFFESQDEAMRSRLKPLFIKGKVKNVIINKILVDDGSTENLMSHFMLQKVGKFDTGQKPHNMVLSNYEGKIERTLGVIQVDLKIGTITRTTMFMVIASKSNYNMLLGREWIHDIGAVPSSMHQRITVWKSDGIVERRNIYRNLGNIAPCRPVYFAFDPNVVAYYSLHVHPNYGF